MRKKIPNSVIGDSLELAPPGYGDGISLQLAKKIQRDGPSAELSDAEKSEIIKNAETKFGEFLTALGVDWENDPNSMETPRRVAKAYVLDLWKGRYERSPTITNFDNKKHYDGIIFEGDIPITSMCSHHHQAITGFAHIGYIPSENGKVIGLSKINRMVEHFARRSVIQEGLTVSIHHAIDQACVGNCGVAVVIEAAHNCVRCRGIKHHQSVMKTYKLSGQFQDKNKTAHTDFYRFIEK